MGRHHEKHGKIIGGGDYPYDDAAPYGAGGYPPYNTPVLTPDATPGSETVTVTEGPSDAAWTATIDYAIDGGGAQQATASIAAGDGRDAIATAVAAALNAELNLAASATANVVNITVTGTSLTTFTVTLS